MTTSIVVDNASKTFRYQAHPTLKKVLQDRFRGDRRHRVVQGPRRGLVRGRSRGSPSD